MKILIVEDRQPLADEYIRIFRHLNEGDFTYTHVPSISAAVKPLMSENWDVILMDSELGEGHVLEGAGTEGEDVKLNNGYDLVSFRRDAENNVEKISRSFIIAATPNRVALRLFQDVGTDTGFLKLEIPKMAAVIRELAKETL
jgi:DNA-binding NarL/FixJ family response regulator